MQIELKVKVTNKDVIIQKIKDLGAKFWKKTTETDTYFNSLKGIFKLEETSEGECLLIHDVRSDKSATALRTELPLDSVYQEKLVKMLRDTTGVKIVLSKIREQYIYHGILIALDNIQGHDVFLELFSDEIYEKDVIGEKKKMLQLLSQFGFAEKDLEIKSYVDLYV